MRLSLIAMIAMLSACNPSVEPEDSGCDLKHTCGNACCADGEACLDTGCARPQTSASRRADGQCRTGGEQCISILRATLGAIAHLRSSAGFPAVSQDNIVMRECVTHDLDFTPPRLRAVG